MNIETLILGAGPAGLGAAGQLKEQNRTDFLVLEKHHRPGGLSASFRVKSKENNSSADDFNNTNDANDANDGNDYIFDIGGHVFFTKEPRFIKISDQLLGNDKITHTRNASVYVGQTTVPYPFQDNIACLEPELQLQTARDFLSLQLNKQSSTTVDRRFYYWIRQVFGNTISNLFMTPYNKKVWACDLKKMGSYWIKDRVSTLTLDDILKRIVYKEKKGDWGPNASFFFPRYGTGQLFEKAAQRVEAHIRYNSTVTAVDTEKQTVTVESGETFRYQRLITTIPLTELVKITTPFTKVALPMPDKRKTFTVTHQSLKNAALSLRYNAGYVVGLGLDFDIESDRHWIYFPEDRYPWFRMTVISNYSPNMTPKGKSSLMFDISLNPYRPKKITPHHIMEALPYINFLPKITEKNIAALFEIKTKYFYPIPTLDRDKHLEHIQTFLKSRNILSIGRFGGWRYEEGNMDHAFLKGMDTVD